MDIFELNLKSNTCTIKKLKKHIKIIIKANFIPVFQINAYPQYITEYILQNNISIYKNKNSFIPLNKITVKLNKYIKKIYDKTDHNHSNENDMKKAVKLSKISLEGEIKREKKILQPYFQPSENKYQPSENKYQKSENKSNIKKCPYCFAPIIKSGGCSHMKCAACNKHFYWENAMPF